MALPLPTDLGTAASTTTVSTISITTSAAVASGDTVYVLVSCGATLPSAVSVTDSGSNTYSAAYALDASGVAIFRSNATGAVALGGTITITLTGGTSAVSVAAHSMSQVKLGSGAAAQVYSVASSVTHSHSISETASAYMLVLDVSFGSASSVSSAAPFTLIDSVTSAASRGLCVAYHEPVSTGSSTFTATWGAAHSGQITALTETVTASSSTAHLLALTGAGA